MKNFQNTIHAQHWCAQWQRFKPLFLLFVSIEIGINGSSVTISDFLLLLIRYARRNSINQTNSSFLFEIGRFKYEQKFEKYILDNAFSNFLQHRDKKKSTLDWDTRKFSGIYKNFTPFIYIIYVLY